MKFEINQEMKRKLFQVLLVAVIKEVYFWMCPDQNLLNTILKVVAGAAVFLICYGLKNRPYRTEQKLILISVVIFIIADILIKWVFLASGALFLIGHLLLVICFWIHRKPNTKCLIIWALITVIEAPLLIMLLTSYDFSVLIGCLGALYGSVLAMMLVCAFLQEKTVTAAAVMFAFSDLFLALSMASAALKWFHAPCILLFYLSIGLFLLHCAGTDQYK